jgi:hypothetical protein
VMGRAGFVTGLTDTTGVYRVVPWVEPPTPKVAMALEPGLNILLHSQHVFLSNARQAARSAGSKW